MTELSQRSWHVQIGRLEVDPPLRVAFELERSTRPQPNTGTIRLYNLSRTSRGLIEEAGGSVVRLEAGYVDGRAQIFQGTVSRARANKAPPIREQRDGFEVVSVIDVTDSGDRYRSARVSQTFDAGVSVLTVLRACARALGVGDGNLREVEGLAELDGGLTTYPEGTLLSGQASRELARILRSYGLRYSIQHGALQVTRRGRALQSQAVDLRSGTGLVGYPEIGARGRVSATSLLSPDLWPGRRVVLSSALVEGQFLVESMRYEGDSHGDPWYAQLELAPEATA